jgi:hypothetical protein
VRVVPSRNTPTRVNPSLILLPNKKFTDGRYNYTILRERIRIAASFTKNVMVVNLYSIDGGHVHGCLHGLVSWVYSHS